MLTVNKEKCTACGACVQICPKECIELLQDEKGFLFPEIDFQKCIKCRACENICPLKKGFYENKFNQKAYAAVNKDHDEVKKATSGGVFGALSKHVLDNKGVVYGCAYDKNLKPVHIRIENIKDLNLLNGSKYVQSDTLRTFITAKEDLEKGKLVVYSGTPCQISGFKSFLKKHYDNLITVDIICHGVPSFSAFKKYTQFYEDKHKIKLRNYIFRTSNKFGGSYAGKAVGTSTENDKPRTKNIKYYNEYYYHYFLSSEICRESCYKCDYANLNRTGDFTLGDFWGAEGEKLPFDIKRGCSLVLVNTKKACELFDKLNISTKEISINKAIKYNQQLQKPVEKPSTREEIVRRFREFPANEIQKAYLKENRLSILKAKIKYSIPSVLKSVILKIRYR